MFRRRLALLALLPLPGLALAQAPYPGPGPVPPDAPFLGTGDSAARTRAARAGDIATPEGFFAKGDGVTDDTAGVQAACSSGKAVYLPHYYYVASATVTCQNSTIFGAGAKHSGLIGGSALPLASPILAVGATTTAHDFGISYESGAIADTETAGQRVAIASVVPGTNLFALQRGSALYNLYLSHVGTGIYDDPTAPMFSVGFRDIEVNDFSFRGTDIEGTSRTGSVWSNIYIVNGRSAADRGFYMVGDESELSLDQINVEHSILNYAVDISNVQGLRAGTIHLEGVQQTGSGTGYVKFSNVSGLVQTMAFLNTRMNLTNPGVIELGDATGASSDSHGTADLRIGLLQTQGLNDPNSGLYPGYTNKGLQNTTGYALLLRPNAAAGIYNFTVDKYIWRSYQASAADFGYYQSPNLDPNSKTNIRHFDNKLANQIRNPLMTGAIVGTPGTFPLHYGISVGAITGLTTSIVTASGSENGLTYTDIRVNGTPVGSGNIQIFLESSQIITALANQTWTINAFHKLAAGAATNIGAFSIAWNDQTLGGAFIANHNNAVATPTNAALNSQYITSANLTLTAGTTIGNLLPLYQMTVTSGNAIDITLRLAKPQLVQVLN